MKKKSLALILGLGILASLYTFDSVYFRDEVDFLSPLDIKELRIRNDVYGDGHFGAKRKHGRWHTGVDIAAPIGTPVIATKNGWAVRWFDEGGYGIYVRIYHSDGLTSLYGHLNDANMRWIRRVRQGDVIGWVGRSGNADCDDMVSHVHFEVRKGKSPVNPEICLR